MSNLRPMRTRDIIIEAVTTLPTGSDRYDGRTVDYWPSGAVGTAPCWTLRWRGAANGGSGAWVYIGGVPDRNAGSASGGQTTANVSTWAAMTNGPSLTVPDDGVYWLIANGTIQGPASQHEARVRIVRDGPTTQLSVCAIQIAPASFMGYHGGSQLQHTLTAGWTISLQIATNNTSVNFGNVVSWRLLMQPLEIRP
jgi:hypothetical protein